jgi:hypothetical protein
MLRPYFVRFVANNSPSFLADSRQQPIARMKQSVIQQSLFSSLIARKRFFNGARVF